MSVAEMVHGERAPERGQVVLILAFAFVGLIALLGLVVDAAIVYTNNAHLRRAIDAAAVAAVGQYRETRDLQDMYDTARQFMQLQMPSNLSNVRLYWCDTKRDTDDDPSDNSLVDMHGIAYDPHIPFGETDEFDFTSLCAAPSQDPRKRLRVLGWLDVHLTFMGILGMEGFPLFGRAESEAAVVNLVMLIDTSESMAYDTCAPNLPEDQFFACLSNCINNHNCEPFESVRTAAVEFMDYMRDGVDRAAIYHFDKAPVVTQSIEMLTCFNPAGVTVPITLTPTSGRVISLTATKQDVLDALLDYDDLNVYIRPETGCVDPPYAGGWVGESFRWASTNIGGGLLEATVELEENGSRDIAIWVVVLLTDGSANSSDRAADENDWWTCPSPVGSGGPNERTIKPFCQDPEVADGTTDEDPDTVTRHCGAQFDPVTGEDVCQRLWYTNEDDIYLEWHYDADDYARDMADLAASRRIALYTIGFGPLVSASGSGRADAGERLMRYIADVGDDGDNATAPCGSDFYWDEQHVSLPDPGESCGNYFAAPTIAELRDVFTAIAAKVFSRITQ